jgi:hypothetical protein
MATNVTIKRRATVGGAYVELHPKTNVAQVEGLSSLITTAFDSLQYVGSINPNETPLKTCVATAFAAKSGERSLVGLYFVASANGTLTTNSSAEISGVLWSDNTLQTGSINTIQTGDWFVIDSVSGGGSSEQDPLIVKWGVINNVYEDASATVKGIVQLSSQTAYASLTGNKVITDGKLKALIDSLDLLECKGIKFEVIE